MFFVSFARLLFEEIRACPQVFLRNTGVSNYINLLQGGASERSGDIPVVPDVPKEHQLFSHLLPIVPSEQ